MSYGVKYRLEFSDVLGFGKKVEILKKDYTGDILPLIGRKNPVQISWQSSDDFYKPIIGSKCQLSLLVTETVQYDDFYKFDEREYKVKISYEKSLGEILYDRVITDGGKFESIDCVDSGLINSRVTPIQWGDYWTGFLVVDRYKEKIITPPFAVTFNAFDGLGTLSNYSAPISENYTPSNPVQLTDAKRIDLILDNLGLDLNVNYINDIKLRLISKFPNFTTISAGLREQTNGYDILNAKTQLELLLKTYNLRLFQSFNQWYIVESTNIFDKFVKDVIYNEVSETGISPRGIRQKITNQLNSTKKEFQNVLKFVDGVYNSESVEDILMDVPNDLIPIGSSLNVEYLQPLGKIVTKSQGLNETNAFYNAGLEYGTDGFLLSGTAPQGTPFANKAELDQTFSFQGNNSIKYSVTTQTSGLNVFFQMAPFETNNISAIINDLELDFNYFVDINSISDNGITNRIEYWARIVKTTNTSITRDWDQANSRWVSQTEQPSNVSNFVEQTDFNKWKNLKINFNDTDLQLAGTQDVKLIVSFCATQCSDAGYLTTHYDNIKLIDKSGISDNEKTVTSKINNGKTYTSEKNITRFFQTTYRGYLRSRDSFGTDYLDSLSLDNYLLQNQNIANDYRSFVSRYEGNFRNTKIKPLSIHNKIWFNFETGESDPQTTLIDGLKYDVKNAEYSIKSHLPNDDDDVDLITIYR